MIAAFIRAEYASTVNQDVRRVLQLDDIDEAIVLDPDIANAEHNLIRQQVLRKTREYPDSALFYRYPRSVRLVAAALTNDDLRRVRYINQDIWTELSGSSRMASEAASRLLSPAAARNFSRGASKNATVIQQIAGAIRSGINSNYLGPLILAAKRPGDVHIVRRLQASDRDADDRGKLAAGIASSRGVFASVRRMALVLTRDSLTTPSNGVTYWPPSFPHPPIPVARRMISKWTRRLWAAFAMTVGRARFRAGR